MLRSPRRPPLRAARAQVELRHRQRCGEGVQREGSEGGEGGAAGPQAEGAPGAPEGGRQGRAVRLGLEAACDRWVS